MKENKQTFTTFATSINNEPITLESLENGFNKCLDKIRENIKEWKGK